MKILAQAPTPPSLLKLRKQLTIKFKMLSKLKLVASVPPLQAQAFISLQPMWRIQVQALISTHLSFRDTQSLLTRREHFTGQKHTKIYQLYQSQCLPVFLERKLLQMLTQALGSIKLVQLCTILNRTHTNQLHQRTISLQASKNAICGTQ